ncbi:MAG TPA: DeoR/GlpR transcriptional regulator [Clostridiales bacterium]|nr:DeoR/GlpR transcriptional regulator [Clostridiales bacterium]
MLTEERHSKILKLLQDKKAVSVTELTGLLGTSESTIRRDLNTLGEMGKLNKVHGGATVIENSYSLYEEDVETKAQKCIKEKQAIAKYAANLINDEDFIYLDAGTTTAMMIDYIGDTKATFVTNGISHAKALLLKGLKAYIIGGQLKLSTEAIVGAEGVSNIRKYNFTKAFLGINSISAKSGYSTPDMEEALIKMEARNNSFVTFVLADHTKFNRVSAVTVGNLNEACIITDKLSDKSYEDYTVVREVLA